MLNTHCITNNYPLSIISSTSDRYRRFAYAGVATLLLRVVLLSSFFRVTVAAFVFALPLPLHCITNAGVDRCGTTHGLVHFIVNTYSHITFGTKYAEIQSNGRHRHVHVFRNWSKHRQITYYSLRCNDHQLTLVTLEHMEIFFSSSFFFSLVTNWIECLYDVNTNKCPALVFASIER
jgi:hypothetical protein